MSGQQRPGDRRRDPSPARPLVYLGGTEQGGELVHWPRRDGRPTQRHVVAWAWWVRVAPARDPSPADENLPSHLSRGAPRWQLAATIA